MISKLVQSTPIILKGLVYNGPVVHFRSLSVVLAQIQWL